MTEEIKKKSLEELEIEYANVMNNKVITEVTSEVLKNEGNSFDDVEFMQRTRKYAPEMRKIIDTTFGVPQ